MRRRSREVLLRVAGCALLTMVIGCIEQGGRPVADDPTDTTDTVQVCTLTCEEGVGADCQRRVLDADACACIATLVEAYDACDDGDACTWSDRCLPGSGCQGILLDVANACDDGNACTADRCEPAVGCVNAAADEAPCSDDNTCTVGEACDAGQCSGGEDACGACDVTNDRCEANFGNGDACDGVLVCRDGLCAADPSTRISCDEPVVGACTVSICDPEIGACRAVPRADSSPCSDGVPCTVADACEAGICSAGALQDDQCACRGDGDCRELDDGDACNGVFACVDGRCTEPEASRVTCPSSDPNGCVVNRCDPSDGLCKPEGLPPQPCDDGNPCTIMTACNGLGVCQGEPLDCSGFSGECSTGRCDPALGCVAAPKSAGEPCTDNGDQCAASSACADGRCETVTTLPCDDGDACTVDSCDAGVGCIFQGPERPTCLSAGVCSAGVPPVCEGDVYRCGYEQVPDYGVIEVCDGLDNDCNGERDDACVEGGGCAVGAAVVDYGDAMRACRVTETVSAADEVCGAAWARCGYTAYASALDGAIPPEGFLLSAAVARDAGVWSVRDTLEALCVGFDGVCEGDFEVQAVTFDGLYMGAIAFATQAWACGAGASGEMCAAARFDGVMCCRAECERDEDCIDDSPCTVDKCEPDAERCSNVSPMPPECSDLGVCAAGVPTACQGDGQLVCNFGAVTSWEPTETLCDGLDNDCDGNTDPEAVCPPSGQDAPDSE
ncbi:MAG: hypothetical protein ACI9MR_000939 [Myxococcota bacterium]|jgi:hypothetical protein